MERKHVRTLDQVFKDRLWPVEGLGHPDPYQSLRHQAMYEVLCSIPEKDYAKLEEAANSDSNSFAWFIPDRESHGCVQPFPITVTEDRGNNLEWTYAKVLYLSPCLEHLSFRTTLAVVAHELAHLALGHKVFTREEYNAQEEEAWSLASKWGFEEEVKYHRANIKRFQTRRASNETGI